MKRATRIVVLLVSGVFFSAGAFAQSADPQPADQQPADQKPPSYDFATGLIDVGVQARPDVASSKFQEYREVVNGVIMPAFRMLGREGALKYDLRGENVKQLDERYTGYLKNDAFALYADYNSIVHNIGNNGRTFLIEQGAGEWRMSQTLQQTFQNIWESTTNANRNFVTFVTPLFTPSIQEGSTVDVQVVRERTTVSADLVRNQPFSLKLNYYREQRHGSGGLSSNYLNYQTETPQVTEYLTQDYGIGGNLDKPWGNVRGALHYNFFEDQVKSLVFDSPFRATDALVATVGTGAAATSVGGPTYGRMINPPDNQAYIETFGTTIKLAHTTRITGDVNLSQFRQNDQFFPYLTNTAVTTPLLAAQTSSLPAQSLNGKINNTSLVFAFTSKPVDVLNLAVRWRYYDLDNQTPRITFPGYGAWDRSWTATPRITVPYGNTNSRLDATAGVDIYKDVTFEGGFRRIAIDRTFRETEQTSENIGSIALVYHAMQNQANLRGFYEFGARDYSGLDLGASEDAGVPTPPTGPPANALERPGSLRFDQSKRHSNRVGVNFDISPWSMTSLAFSVLHNNDDYLETHYGLQNASYDTWTAEATVTPGERWSVSGYYTHEKGGNSQVNNGTSNFPAIDDFTINLHDDVDTAGASAFFTLVPKRALLNLAGRYQNLKGTAGFLTNPGSSYQLARAAYGGVKDIPNADNAKLTRVDAYVDCPLTGKVTITVGVWYEDYVFSDVDSVGLQNMYPGAFFLALNDGSYHATVGYARLIYHW